ncbi:MAG: hypothetical protein V4719_04315 [Planctomycetota bacterium]
MLIDRIRRYEDLCSQVSEAQKYSEVVRLLDEFRLELRSMPPSVSEIASLLQQVRIDPKMSGASLTFVSAWSNISDEYTDVLCEILTDQNCSQWHEQTVELLAELPNPELVPILTKALGYRWNFDEWNCIPRKALAALFEINTPEAIAAIRYALNSDEQSIRDEAMELLEKVDL